MCICPPVPLRPQKKKEKVSLVRCHGICHRPVKVQPVSWAHRPASVIFIILRIFDARWKPSRLVLSPLPRFRGGSSVRDQGHICATVCATRSMQCDSDFDSILILRPTLGARWLKGHSAHASVSGDMIASLAAVICCACLAHQMARRLGFSALHDRGDDLLLLQR